jgi:hypothetical protein
MSSKIKFDPTKPITTKIPSWARILATDSTAEHAGVKTPIIAEYDLIGLGMRIRKVGHFTGDGINAENLNSNFPWYGVDLRSVDVE